MIAVLVMLLTLLVCHYNNQNSGKQRLFANSKELTDYFISNCNLHNLTPREIEISILIRNGYKNRKIADQLHISEKTVESHLQNIYDKVGERSKFALISKLNQ
ncbi:response regulator transcription factor [Mucilaginibacter polytrichastri]|nr:LuxR C-terminal-related transcriptional regulator [Mucilaginibacter polytrichastri]